MREIEAELGKQNADMSEGLKSEFTELYHRALNLLEVAESWFDVSTSIFADCAVCEGNFYTAWNGVGYKTLFDILTKQSRRLSGDDFYSRVVSVDTEVRRIFHGNDNARKHVLVVECLNDRTIFADHVIMTVSVGVLRERHTTLFEKFPLPDTRKYVR